jgi:hypothetical protein
MQAAAYLGMSMATFVKAAERFKVSYAIRKSVFVYKKEDIEELERQLTHDRRGY